MEDRLESYSQRTVAGGRKCLSGMTLLAASTLLAAIVLTNMASI